jgi:hypothetical protein
MSWSSAGQESPAMIAAAAPCSSDRATVLRDTRRCWAAYSDGPMVRWAGLGRAIQAAKRGRVLTLPRSDASYKVVLNQQQLLWIGGSSKGLIYTMGYLGERGRSVVLWRNEAIVC